MRIIVVGAGKVGTALCRSLVDEKHDVILIEEKEEVLKRISKRYDVMGFAGNGANFKILEQAEVNNCDVFIAMTDKDEVNMISAVLAKQMGAKETIVRVRNPEYSNTYFKDKNFLGFSLVVNPELLTARYIANTVEFPNALSVETFANGRVILMAFSVTETSRLSGMTMEQFRKKFGNILVCTIDRQGDLTIPDGNATMQAGDKIYVTGKRVDMALFHSYIKPKSIKKLLLIGAGRIYPVGRLDWDTTGLLILTNDGDFTDKMIHPRNEIDKVYLARVKGIATKENLRPLTRGVVIDGKKNSAGPLQYYQGGS